MFNYRQVPLATFSEPLLSKVSLWPKPWQCNPLRQSLAVVNTRWYESYHSLLITTDLPNIRAPDLNTLLLPDSYTIFIFYVRPIRFTPVLYSFRDIYQSPVTTRIQDETSSLFSASPTTYLPSTVVQLWATGCLLSIASIVFFWRKPFLSRLPAKGRWLVMNCADATQYRNKIVDGDGS